MAYRVTWSFIGGVLAAFGLAAAVIALPLDVLIALGVLVAVVGLTAFFGYDERPAEPNQYTRRRSALLATAGAATVAGIAGLGAVLHANVVWLLLLAGITCPPAVHRYGRWLKALGQSSEVERPLMCSTADLCRQWRDSYDALQGATTPIARLHIVMARQRCLDELERRDPEGLHAWLEAAGSAAGDPGRFLTHDDSDRRSDT